MGSDLAAHPARHDSRETPGSAPRHHDHDFLRRGKLGDERIGIRRPGILEAPALRAVGPGLELPRAAAHRLEEVALHVLLGPSRAADGLGVLGPNDPEGVAVEGKALVIPHARRRPAQRGDELWRLAAQMVVDDEGPLAREDCHRALAMPMAALDVERLPGRDLLVLADAVGVAAGMAEGGHGNLTRPGAPEIDHDEPEGAADGGIGAEAGAKDTGRAVDTQSLADGTVHDDQRRRGIRRARLPVEIEGRIAGRLDDGKHDGKVVRTTPGHDGVDGELLHRCPTEIGRHLGNQRLTRPPRRLDHALYTLARRRHHGEAVGDAALEPDLHLVGHSGAQYTDASRRASVLLSRPLTRPGGHIMRTPHAIVAALVAMLGMGAPTAHAQQTVKIGTTPSFIFLPIYAAEQLGYFKAEGITAQFVDFEGGAEVTTAMVGGSIDLGGTMAERPLILAEKRFGAKNLVALEPDKDVAIIAVGGVSSANAALKAGQIDGFMGGEPAGAVAVEQLKLARYFLDPRVGQGPRFLQFMTFPTLQASDKWIAANPQTAEKLVRGMLKTLRRMREDPESAVGVGQRIFPALDVGVIRSIIAIEKTPTTRPS